MISVEMEDVLAVLQLCKPYIIGIIAVLVIGIVIMIACRRMSRGKRFLIRGEAAIAMVLAVVVCVNMICFGPMSTLIGLATGNGTLSDDGFLFLLLPSEVHLMHPCWKGKTESHPVSAQWPLDRKSVV